MQTWSFLHSPGVRQRAAQQRNEYKQAGPRCHCTGWVGRLAQWGQCKRRTDGDAGRTRAARATKMLSAQLRRRLCRYTHIRRPPGMWRGPKSSPRLMLAERVGGARLHLLLAPPRMQQANALPSPFCCFPTRPLLGSCHVPPSPGGRHAQPAVALVGMPGWK